MEPRLGAPASALECDTLTPVTPGGDDPAGQSSDLTLGVGDERSRPHLQIREKKLRQEPSSRDGLNF